jgi:hypothetical protein
LIRLWSTLLFKISNSANGKTELVVSAHLIDRDFGKSDDLKRSRCGSVPVVGDTAHKKPRLTTS